MACPLAWLLAQFSHPLSAILCKDLAEVCKRDGAERDEKGVDRVLGLGSSR